MPSGFKEKVNSVVLQIPEGKVMTYGQIAAICGNAKAARVVGGIAHFGDQSLPWHRVVNYKGRMASGYPGGRKAHKLHLQREGVMIDPNNYIENLESYTWEPSNLS